MYKRGKRLVFACHSEKGAKPSTSAKQGPSVQDKDMVEHEFELVDLEAENYTSSMQHMIRDKYYQIKELPVNMARERYIMSFLE